MISSGFETFRIRVIVLTVIARCNIIRKTTRLLTNNSQRTAQMVFQITSLLPSVEFYVSLRRTGFSLGVKKAPSSCREEIYFSS